MSGGLDSQLAVRVLQRAGAEVEAVCFRTPFFGSREAEAAAQRLGVVLHTIDFTDDEIALIEHPPHGFGSAMNPCIDCHAKMISRAGELMERLGFDFVATGEVQGQRPMSQNRQALALVERISGLAGRLVRPLSALLLEPTIPEREGLLDRGRLLDLSGRGRERQLALAAEFGLVDFPSPAGGCKLTEAGFARKLRDLLDHEGLRERALVELLTVGRRFRLPGGTGVILGRDQAENAVLRDYAPPASRPAPGAAVLAPVNAPGPTAVLPAIADEADVDAACRLVCAYSRCDRLQEDVRVSVSRRPGEATCVAVPRPYDRAPFKDFQIC